MRMTEKYILGDCIKEMSKIKDRSIDMIFAALPYNLQLSKPLLRPDHPNVKGVSHEWDKFNSFEAYDIFTFKWLTETRRVLKKDGYSYFLSKISYLGFPPNAYSKSSSLTPKKQPDLVQDESYGKKGVLYDKELSNRQRLPSAIDGHH